MSYRNI